jgi:hypothetical protein
MKEAREARDRGEVKQGQKVRIMVNGKLSEHSLGTPN